MSDSFRRSSISHQVIHAPLPFILRTPSRSEITQKRSSHSLHCFSLIPPHIVSFQRNVGACSWTVNQCVPCACSARQRRPLGR